MCCPICFAWSICAYQETVLMIWWQYVMEFERLVLQSTRNSFSYVNSFVFASFQCSWWFWCFKGRVFCFCFLIKQQKSYFSSLAKTFDYKKITSSDNLKGFTTDPRLHLVSLFVKCWVSFQDLCVSESSV